MTDIYTICPICGKEFKFEAGFYTDTLETHLKKDHSKIEISNQLACLWFGLARQVVEDDVFIKEITKHPSQLHEAERRNKRAEILSKVMNDWRIYKR